MKFLIIEDEPLIQKSLRKMLETQGHQVKATAKGREAIEMLKCENFDRIICDLMLTDITGFDVLEEFRSHYGSNDIPNKFIIITAYCSDQVLHKANTYGCKVINKPFKNITQTIKDIGQNEIQI